MSVQKNLTQLESAEITQAYQTGESPVVADNRPVDDDLSWLERRRLERREIPGTMEWSRAYGYLARLGICDVLAIYTPIENVPDHCWRHEGLTDFQFRSDDLLSLALDSIWWETDKEGRPESVERGGGLGESLMNFDEVTRIAIFRKGKLQFEEPFDFYSNPLMQEFDGIVEFGIRAHEIDDAVIQSKAAFDAATRAEDEAREHLLTLEPVREVEPGQVWWDAYPEAEARIFLDAQSRCFDTLDQSIDVLRKRVADAGYRANLVLAHYRTDFFLQKQVRKRGPRMPSLQDQRVVGASRLEQGVGINFCALRNWKQSAIDHMRMEATHRGTNNTFQVTSSLPVLAWESIKDKPAVVVKAWHVFEALRFDSGDPMEPFPITPDQVMREIKGCSRTRYTPSEKHEATKLVDAIMSLECSMHWKDRANRFHRTRGPLYIRTVMDEVFEDLFEWVPNAVLIRVNPDLYDRQNAEFVKQFAPYHRAFLTLNAQRDESALFLGSYILLKSRPQWSQHAPGEARFRNKSLLKVYLDTGMLDLKALIAQRQLAQVSQKIDRDLEKLREVGLISGWQLKGADAYEGPDLAPDDCDIEDLFPEDLPIVRERRGNPSTIDKRLKGRLSHSRFWDWHRQTTVLQLSEVSTLAQKRARLKTPNKDVVRGHLIK